MGFYEDDLTSLFAAPSGPSQPMSYRQGVIQTFNKVTLQHTILIGGAVLTDLPILGVAEAASLSAGSVVGVMVVGSTWAIIGRIVQPNTVQATDAITQLGQASSSAGVATFQTTTSAAFTDLATAGPAVTADIGASGKALVTLSAYISLSTVSTHPAAAHMGFAITGANAQAPDIDRTLALEGNEGDALAASRTVLLAGLTPGASTFTAKYNFVGGTAGFSGRNLTVVAL